MKEISSDTGALRAWQIPNTDSFSHGQFSSGFLLYSPNKDRNWQFLRDWQSCWLLKSQLSSPGNPAVTHRVLCLTSGSTGQNPFNLCLGQLSPKQTPSIPRQMLISSACAAPQKAVIQCSLNFSSLPPQASRIQAIYNSATKALLKRDIFIVIELLLHKILSLFFFFLYIWYLKL